jgi:hypothetical protein
MVQVKSRMLVATENPSATGMAYNRSDFSDKATRTSDVYTGGAFRSFY